MSVVGNELEQGLISLGLDKNEARIYLSLLKLKSAPVGEIAKDSSVHRRTVYDTLVRLLNKGHVTYVTKNDTKHYQAADVNRLIDIVKHREKVLESILPKLASLEDKRVYESVAVYEGTGGLKSILRGALEFAKGDEIIGFGDTGKVSELIPDYMAQWNAKRVREKIKIRRIFNRTDSVMQNLKKTKRIPLNESRIMSSKFTSSLGVWICRDRTILWFLKEKPLAIVIESSEIADGFKEYFDFMWQQSEVIK